MSKALVDRYEAFILDLDGVIYLRFEPITGALDTIDYLQECAKPFVFMTNNASTSPGNFVKRLSDIGIEVEEENIVTSSQAMGRHLADNYEPEGKRVFVIGEEALKAELRAQDMLVLDESDDAPADFVVVGWDHEFSYDKLKRATIAIRNGAHFLATNADTTYPTPDGLWPGAGSLLVSVVAASGKEPDLVGKPNTIMVEMALERMRKAPRQVLMVGDRLETDILAGNRYGVDTLLVLSGVSKEEDIGLTGIKPTYISSNISSLLRDRVDAHWTPE